VIDKKMLSLINKIGEKRLAPLFTDDFLLIDALFHERKLTDNLRLRIKRLIDSGIVEHTGRDKYVLARSLYDAVGKSGTYTQRVGLDHETNKELILKHIIILHGDKSTPLNELYQALPGHSRGQLQALLKALRNEQRIHPQGKTSAAKWFAGTDNE
jgi:ATP-dependent DNA helicase RecG